MRIPFTIKTHEGKESSKALDHDLESLMWNALCVYLEMQGPGDYWDANYDLESIRFDMKDICERYLEGKEA